MSTKKFVSLALAIVLGLIAWIMPPETIGIPDLTVVEQRVISIFIFAAIMWVTEVVPIWTTSVLIMVLMLVTVSNNSLWFMRTGSEFQELGTLIRYQNIMATFADPVIMLFLGGFILAIGATKCGLDVNLARVLLKPFGTRSEVVMLGFIIVTALFSMFMSNTATAAMMLAILAPVLRVLPVDGKGRVGLALCIPVAANVGGMGTPIGTPPNAIALSYLNNPDGLNMNITFGDWVMVMTPYVVVLLAISWMLLIRIFPFKQKHVEIKIPGTFRTDTKAMIVYVTFALTVLLWVTDRMTGLNANIVALIPFAVFSITGIIDTDDLKQINWDVLWLVAGGFALGVGLHDTGLAEHIIRSKPFHSWPPVIMIIGSGLLCCLMSTFMSNTATAALLIPILAVAGRGMGPLLDQYGGICTLLVGVAMSASLAMALPISTPPNALSHATGMIKQAEMARIGILVGVIGIGLAYAMLIFLGETGLFGA